MDEQLEYEVKRLMAFFGVEAVNEVVAVLTARHDEQMATGDDDEN